MTEVAPRSKVLPSGLWLRRCSHIFLLETAMPKLAALFPGYSISQQGSESSSSNRISLHLVAKNPISSVIFRQVSGSGFTSVSERHSCASALILPCAKAALFGISLRGLRSSFLPCAKVQAAPRLHWPWGEI